VKPNIATKYGLDIEMSDDTRKGVESIRQTHIEKRKKVYSRTGDSYEIITLPQIWEDKEGPLTKRHKKSVDEKGLFASACRRRSLTNTQVSPAIR